MYVCIPYKLQTMYNHWKSLVMYSEIFLSLLSKTIFLPLLWEQQASRYCTVLHLFIKQEQFTQGPRKNYFHCIVQYIKVQYRIHFMNLWVLSSRGIVVLFFVFSLGLITEEHTNPLPEVRGTSVLHVTTSYAAGARVRFYIICIRCICSLRNHTIGLLEPYPIVFHA